MAENRKATKPLRTFDDNQDPGLGVKNRREYLEGVSGIDLSALENKTIRPQDVIGKNIENLTGEMSIPVGIAGPVKINGIFTQGHHYIPCATTEGALIASISRGCKVLTAAEGITTSVAYRGISRAPLFELNGTKELQDIEKLVKNMFTELAEAAAQTSNHLKLTEVDTYTLGKYLWLRLSYDTQEAMGMNMATTATEKICERIEQFIPSCKLVSLSGNMCVDKKANWLNVIKGRGYDVTAECLIPETIIKEHLDTSAKEIAKVCRTKNWYGSAMSGSVAFNAQAANVVSAVFLATGQDVAHTIESSQVFTIAEETDEGLYIAVKVPNVICGSVGGGTWLPPQKAAMSLMLTDIDQPQTNQQNAAYQFAEILAAAILAGELSLISALCTNTLASAHRKHTRKESSN